MEEIEELKKQLELEKQKQEEFQKQLEEKEKQESEMLSKLKKERDEALANLLNGSTSGSESDPFNEAMRSMFE